jgi:hypothetical protein
MIMGKELQGAVRVGKERHQGKILLETSELIFRGKDYRLKITFGEMRDVQAKNGELRIATRGGALTFELGTAAEKWREKILHPKTRVQKLGVKEGIKVRLLGELPGDFVNELKAAGAEIMQASGSANADHNFIAAEGQSSLAAMAKHAKKLKDAEALWVVYEKGKKDLTENDVIAAGRKAGLKDVKVVGFSSTHTALKFVLPLEKR